MLIREATPGDAGAIATVQVRGWQWGFRGSLLVAETVAGTGFGFGLLWPAEDQLRSAGYAEATLWTLAASGRARRFYERQGWAADGATKSEHRHIDDHDVELQEVRFGKHLTEERQ